MAHTIVQDPAAFSSATNATSAAQAYPSNVTAGNLLVAISQVVRTGGADAVAATATDSLGQTWASAGKSPAIAGYDQQCVEIFYRQNTADGACTLTVDYGGFTCQRQAIKLFEVSGIATSAALEAATSGGGTGTAPTAGNVATAGGAFLLSALVTNFSFHTIGLGAGWADAGAPSLWDIARFERRSVTAGGTYAGNYTSSDGARAYAAVVAAFKDGAPAPTLSGAATIDDGAASGGLAPEPPSTLSGGATLDGPTAGGGFAINPGTLTSSGLVLNNDAGHSVAPFEAFVSVKDTGTLIIRKTGLVSSAPALPAKPTVSFSDALLPAPGTQVRVTWRRTDTGAEGTELLVVS